MNDCPQKSRWAPTYALRGLACGCGASGVAAAAFAAHGLESIAGPQQVRWWLIAVFMQLLTAPTLLLVAVIHERIRSASGWLLVWGLTLFSGSLYAMALGGPRWLGAITPLGGCFLIGGWLLAAWPFKSGVPIE